MAYTVEFKFPSGCLPVFAARSFAKAVNAAHRGADPLVPSIPSITLPPHTTRKFDATAETSGTLRWVVDPPFADQLIPTWNDGVEKCGSSHGLGPPPPLDHADSQSHCPVRSTVNVV